MPTKSAHLIAFVLVFLISVGLHRFVFVNLRRVLRRDFPGKAHRLIRAAGILFIAMDSPFLFLYFQRHISWDVSILHRILLYPFSVWQALMIMWAGILIPIRSGAFLVRRARRSGVSAAIRTARDRFGARYAGAETPSPFPVPQETTPTSAAVPATGAEGLPVIYSTSYSGTEQ